MCDRIDSNYYFDGQIMQFCLDRVKEIEEAEEQEKEIETKNEVETLKWVCDKVNEGFNSLGDGTQTVEYILGKDINEIEACANAHRCPFYEQSKNEEE